LGETNRMEKFGRTEEKTEKPERIYWRLKKIVLKEFPDIVSDAVIERDPGDTPRNLRIFLIDSSFIDIF